MKNWKPKTKATFIVFIGLIVLLGAWALINWATTKNTPAANSTAKPNATNSATKSSTTSRSASKTTTSKSTKPAGESKYADCKDLPEEVAPVVKAIKAGGPFKYPRNDGVRFQNRENQLPKETADYYREYTVVTPGSPDRGARRIVTGGDPASNPPLWYYTDNHYDSFCLIKNP